MEKEELEELIKEKHGIRGICKVTGKSYTSVRYWLRKYNLSTNHSLSEVDYKSCPKCNQKKILSQFFSKLEGLSSYCKSCTCENTIYRIQNFKRRCIEYKGGCCSICKYNKCDAALEFHHLDPTQKDFSISGNRCRKFDNKVISELDKCILVCANCHREIHYGMKNGID